MVGEIGAEREPFPSVKLFGEMLELRAGSAKSVRAKNQMQRRFLGLDRFDDGPGPYDRIARLLTGDFMEMMNGLSARLRVGRDRAGSAVDGVRGEEVGAECTGFH